MIRGMQDFHKVQSDKVAPDSALPDYEPLRTKHTDTWDIFSDKKYIVSKNLLRVIHPRRIPDEGILRSEDE